MRYTNNYNLPAPLVSAILNDAYDKVGDISITGLIKPPRMRQLELRHDDQLTEDVSDGIWRLIGSIGHAIIERADQDNHLAEERLTMPVLGWTISGKSDLLAPDMLMSDYKFTSVYSFLLGDKPEWTAQLNLYAALYRHHGFEVKAAQIVAVLRDWQKMRARREPDYPQAQVIVKPVELWPIQKQMEYMVERVRLHQEAQSLIDDELPLCTDEERWRKPDVWAVKKKGNKRALKLFNNADDADSYLAGAPLPKQCEVVHRPGSYPRCENYCAVSEFCSFGKNLAAREDID